MRHTVNRCTIELVEGDITLQEVDAIVNAANTRLAGGGGVDGAIHRRGGPTIMAETERRYPDGCPTGSAVITAGGALRANYVIHAVGPVWKGGNCGEEEQLARAVRTSLELALQHQCRSIALPALSTGAYGYPIDRAARTSLAATIAHLGEHDAPALVRFVLFSAGALAAATVVLEELGRPA